MRMLRKLIISVVALVATYQIGNAQYQNDGKGISYNQLYGCCDTAGVKLDSMFRMTDSLGKLSICISIQNLIDIINEYDTTGGGGGSSSFGCDSVQFCLTEEGLLCEALGDFGTATYVAGDKVIGVTAGGECRQFDLFAINGFGDTVRLVNNADGSYTLRNENNTGFTFGYMLNCINDSTFALTDWDGTAVDTCVIRGGAGGGGGSGSVDCDSLLTCLQDSGLICQILGALPEVGTDAGQKYVVIDELGNCELVDSVYIDVCGVLTEIQDESQLMESDYLFIQRNQDCYRVPWYVEGTDCVELDMQGGVLTSTILVSPDAGNGVECRANGLYASSEASISCDSLKAAFGASNATDIAMFYGGLCVATDPCQMISDAFPAAAYAPGDSLLVQSGVTCKKVPANTFFTCGTGLPDWDEDCQPAYFMVLCGNDVTGWECRKMTCAQLDSLCPPLQQAPFSPTELQGMVDKAVDATLTNKFAYSPSALTNKASEVDYPTVNNMGIRTFKTKLEAEKDKSIPLGGIYYIEGKETMSVKTKQR